MLIDLHVHSAVSDGTDAPAELVAKAAAAGLGAIALTDHDTAAGWAEALTAGAEFGVEVLPGMELSSHARQPGDEGRDDVTDRHSVHVLGYGLDPAEPRLAAELTAIRRGRDERVPRMLERLAELGLPVTLAEVEAQAGAAVVGRPHIADAMVARGYAADRDEVFARWLRNDGPIQVRRHTPEAARAVDLINGAGGVAVLAHPWARGGEGWMTVDVIERLVKENGLGGIEADHLNHDADQRAALHRLADRLGVIATGSSDYHGLGKKNHPLGACTTSPEAYARLKAKLAGGVR
jgi:predicted metal-dependent phosphoesterase TrpH